MTSKSSIKSADLSYCFSQSQEQEMHACDLLSAWLRHFCELSQYGINLSPYFSVRLKCGLGHSSPGWHLAAKCYVYLRMMRWRFRSLRLDTHRIHFFSLGADATGIYDCDSFAFCSGETLGIAITHSIHRDFEGKFAGCKGLPSNAGFMNRSFVTLAGKIFSVGNPTRNSNRSPDPLKEIRRVGQQPKERFVRLPLSHATPRLAFGCSTPNPR